MIVNFMEECRKIYLPPLHNINVYIYLLQILDSELHIIVKKMFRRIFIIILCFNIILSVSGRKFLVETKDVKEEQV